MYNWAGLLPCTNILFCSLLLYLSLLCVFSRLLRVGKAQISEKWGCGGRFCGVFAEDGMERNGSSLK